MARVLEPLKPLVSLLGQADDPVGAAQLLYETSISGSGADVLATLAGAVTDARLAVDVLQHAEVIDEDRHLRPEAQIRIGQARALVEALRENQCELVVTVPSFLRTALTDMLSDRPAVHRPRETRETVVAVATEARHKLVLAAPFLHQGLIEDLRPHVTRLVAAGGHLVVVTRALALHTGQASKANRDAVTALLRAAGRFQARVTVRSWEENGLGVHCKVVLADQSVAYLGSANLTLHAVREQAEVGVMLRGPQLKVLAAWLEQIGSVLAARQSS